MGQPQLPFDNVRDELARARRNLAEATEKLNADLDARRAARERGQAA